MSEKLFVYGGCREILFPVLKYMMNLLVINGKFYNVIHIEYYSSGWKLHTIIYEIRSPASCLWQLYDKVM